MGAYELLHKEFKITIIWMQAEENKDEQNENANKEIENIKKYKTKMLELKNSISKGVQL